jgi:hypothetical protein
MPDRRTHRGPHPEDARLFSAAMRPVLREAAADFGWLLDRGYAHDSALKLVGDRYKLVARQRMAVSRCTCCEADAARRRSHEVGREQLRGAMLWIDGYNVLTSIEAALAGGVILAARDGAYRDMASMHGSYRKVAETLPALELLGRELAADEVSACRWLLDRPVSNSGRLRESWKSWPPHGDGRGRSSWCRTRTSCWPTLRHCRPSVWWWPRPTAPFSTAAPPGSTSRERRSVEASPRRRSWTSRAPVGHENVQCYSFDHENAKARKTARLLVRWYVLFFAISCLRVFVVKNLST